MGIIVHKEDERDSGLNARITADLRTRAQQTTDISDPDLSDAEYAKELKKTGRFAWVWFVLIILALASLALIYLI